MARQKQAKTEPDNIKFQVIEAEVSPATIKALRLQREQVMVEIAISFLERELRRTRVWL